jgi:site-specific recombinase XerD
MQSARLLTQNQADAFTLNWAALRYAHTAAIRAVLQETYAPTPANKMLCALRRVLKEALRLEQLTADDYAKAIDLPAIKRTRLLRGRALRRSEVQALLCVCADDLTAAGARDVALIELLQTGLCRSEVVGLNLIDLKLHTGALTIRNGKGQKDRVA